MAVGGASEFETTLFRLRKAPKNQTRSFQSGPPRVASYVGTVWSVFASP